MATSVKVRLVPLLEWTQVNKGHAIKSDLVAIYNRNENENENVYFERRTANEWSPAEVFGADAKSNHVSFSCTKSFFETETGKHSDSNGENVGGENIIGRYDVICNNKQSSVNNICQPDCDNAETDRDILPGDETEYKGYISNEPAHFNRSQGLLRCAGNDNRNLAGCSLRTERDSKPECNSEDYRVYEPLSNRNVISKEPEIEAESQEAISPRTGTTSDILLTESIKCLDGLSPVICDKNDDRDVPINDHSTNPSISTGYSRGHNIDTVTQTDNRRRSVEDLQGNNRSSDSSGESGGKSWFEGCSGCKHKHPAVRTISAPGERREAIDGGCARSDYSQVDLHPHFSDSYDLSICKAPGPIEGNIKFINTQKGVVKYTPSLIWQVRILDSCPAEEIQVSRTLKDDQSRTTGSKCKELRNCITEKAGQFTLSNTSEQIEQSDLNIRNGNSAVKVAPAAATGAMLPNSNTRGYAAREGVACSAYDSAVTDNYNKLTDESVDDSAVGRTPLLEDGRLVKNKYTERPGVKGAIIDNNPELKSPGCPCCLISPDGPLLEDKSHLPGPCALHIGKEPTNKTDMVDNILKREIYKAEAGQTSLTFRSSSSNIRSSYNGNSPSCDEEEAPIACKRVVFSSDDQLPSGVEGKGMPHVGDIVDSQNSCYGIQRPGAAAIVSSSNTNAKLSIEKTAESSLQLQVVTGKAKLSPETLVLVQTHSEGSRDTSSPISSDAPNSASAGQSQSYAAVLRGNIKVEYHNGAGKPSCPSSQTNVGTRRAKSHHQTVGKKGVKTGLVRDFGDNIGDNMGNQNSSGAAGERSRTPVLGRRKGSTQGLFRAASSSMTRSVPVTPAGTPASIRSEKVGFFRKFRRNKNRSRSDSMASINSVSSCASTASQSYPSRGYEDNTSSASQSSLATNSGIVGESPVHTMAGTVPPSLNIATPPSSVNVPAAPHTFKQQATILQPISERPNEMYLAHTHNRHSDLSSKNEKHLAEKIPDHISVAHRSLSLLKKREGTTGSNLTLTDDGSEYLTASETDLTKTSAGKTSDNIQGFNCDNYKVTRGTHSQSTLTVTESATNKSDGVPSGHVAHLVDSGVDGVRSNTNIEPLHGKSTGSLLPDQVYYQTQHISQGANTPTASTKPKKSDKKHSSSKAKLEKNRTSDQSKTYAAVLGTGLFIANLSDTVSKDNTALPTQGVTDPVCTSPRCVTFPESADSNDNQRVNFPSQPAAPVCQVESPESVQNPDNLNTDSLPRSFADVVSSPSSNKRVVQPPRGPFSSLTSKELRSGVSNTISETDQMPLAPGLHGKLPIALSKHGIRTSHKPVCEPIVQPQNVAQATQPPPAHVSGNYKNIRPRTFATVAGSQGGGGKGQIGVKTVPRGNAGSPATTPDGPGGVTCHSLPRSTLSSAGSAPALGVCGARLRAAKAHSVQQLNATRSPPVSPTKPPESSIFVGTSPSYPQQAKSMPQLAGRIVSKGDSSTIVSKVKSEESVKLFHTETSCLPRPKTKPMTLGKPTAQVTKSKIAVISNEKRKDVASTPVKYSKNLTALAIREPVDEISIVEDEVKQNATMRFSVSAAQECVSESSGSLHRLNTCVQQNTGAKSDKLARSGKLPVTQIPHKERKTAAKSGPDGGVEISKVPVHAQKACPPGQIISSNVEGKISTKSGEQEHPCSDNAQQSKLPDSKSAVVHASSKLPTSSPNKQRSVTNVTKSPQSASNQRQTKQLLGNANIVPSETTKTDTNIVPAKRDAEEKLIEKPSQDLIAKSRAESTSSAVSSEPAKTTQLTETGCMSQRSDDNQIESKTTGVSSSTVRDSSFEKAPAEEERKASAISNVDNSKQENKSDAALKNDGPSSPAICKVNAIANNTQNRPSPQPRNIIKDEEEHKERSATSDKVHSAQEVPFVTDPRESISKITDTSQHEKLTIGHNKNLEQKYTSVSIEKAPTENLVLTAKLNRGSEKPTNNADASISNDQLKGTDVKGDELNNTEMGLGESKYDGAKKVAVNQLSQHQKITLQQGKCDPEGKIIGVSDKGRSNEKVGSISSDSATVKGSQLPVNAKTEYETNVSKLPKRGDGDSTAKPLEQEAAKSPQPPPRTHKVSSINKCQQPPGQKAIHKDQVLSASSHQADSVGKEEPSTVKKKALTDVKLQQPVVELPTNNSVTRRDGSDKTVKSIEITNAAKSVEESEVQDPCSRTSTEVDKQQATVDSVDITRTIPGFISENNTAAGISSSQETSTEGLQITKKIITATGGSKLFKMDDENGVDLEGKSGSVTEKLLAGEASAPCRVDIDVKTDPNSQISQVTQETVINSKQNDKQSEPVDKHAVNIVECKDMQVPSLDNNQENSTIATDNDACEGNTQEADRTSGSKPKIFDEMISVKDVNISSESSSTCTSLEMDEKIQSDLQSVENSATSAEGAISKIEPTVEGATPEKTESVVKEESKQEEPTPKVKISINQTESATEEVVVCDLSTKPKIITEEEVTFTIDIPAECARAGRPLPEVNVYVSATCYAVTSTSGTINTTSQLSGNETTTSVSDDRQALMSVSSGTDLPLTSTSAGGEALSSHQKDETPVNICIDRAPSAAGVVEGSAEVKHAGQKEAGSIDPAASIVDEAAAGVPGTDMNVHTEQVESIAEIVESNEAANENAYGKGQSVSEIVGSRDTTMENNVSVAGNVDSCTVNEINEGDTVDEPQSVQHMDAILSKAEANVQFGSQEEQSTSLSCGKHSDKPSPNESEENNGIAEQHAGTTADPISISKPPESEQAHSTVIASSEGGGCDPGNIELTVEEIGVSCGGTDTASINTPPQIAITTEIANKDSVVESAPAESNVNSTQSANILDYLKVDDHLGLKGAESDSSSIGRLINSSEGEHSDVNLDDIVVRNMEECNIKVKAMESDSSDSSDTESDEESSERESSESEEDNNKVGSQRKGPDTVNDSDLSDDSCDKPKANKIENVEGTTSSGDESSESEDEKPKKCITDEENHIKEREELGAKSPEDCYAAKLENMGHKVGEAYFVTRRRKRAKMVDRETITTCTHEVQCPEVCHVSTDTFDSILISSSGSSDTSPSRVQWEDDSVDELDAGQYDYYSDEEDGEWYEDYSDDSVYTDEEDSQLGATAAGPVKVIYSRPRLDSPREPKRDSLLRH